MYINVEMIVGVVCGLFVEKLEEIEEVDLLVCGIFSFD